MRLYQLVLIALFGLVASANVGETQSEGSPVYLATSSPSGAFYVIYPNTRAVHLCGTASGNGETQFGCGSLGAHP